jgi:hypothetical protein
VLIAQTPRSPQEIDVLGNQAQDELARFLSHVPGIWLEVNRRVTMREGTRSRRVKKGAAWVVKTVNGALSSDPKANKS